MSATTGSSHLQSICESSAIRCPVVSTSSVLWEARPGGDALMTIVRSTSRLCVACLNMQLQPGQLVCQLLPPATLRMFSWRRPKPSPDDCRQTLFTACRQRLERKDWCNTQFLCRINYVSILRFKLKFLPPVSSFSFHQGTGLPLSKQSSHQ